MMANFDRGLAHIHIHTYIHIYIHTYFILTFPKGLFRNNDYIILFITRVSKR